MEHRDRATGWQHAKLSGHKNEDLVKELLDSDRNFQQHFLKQKLSKEFVSIVLGFMRIMCFCWSA